MDKLDDIQLLQCAEKRARQYAEEVRNIDPSASLAWSVVADDFRRDVIRLIKSMDQVRSAVCRMHNHTTVLTQ